MNGRLLSNTTSGSPIIASRHTRKCLGPVNIPVSTTPNSTTIAPPVVSRKDRPQGAEKLARTKDMGALWSCVRRERCAAGALVLRKEFVGKTVQPALPGFGGRDHRMAAFASMFTGMAVRRIVTAQGDTAVLTGPQMHPARVDIDALRTFASLRRPDSTDGFQVTAELLGHTTFIIH